MPMPEKVTIERARRDLRAGARSTQRAIAIGRSKARGAGVPLEPAPAGRSTSQRTRVAAKRAFEVGQGKRKAKAPSRRRQQATTHALRRERRAAASRRAVSAPTRAAAGRRHGRARAS
jgi:hypothetical protein